jgi:hypothetical protein
VRLNKCDLDVAWVAAKAVWKELDEGDWRYILSCLRLGEPYCHGVCSGAALRAVLAARKLKSRRSVPS